MGRVLVLAAALLLGFLDNAGKYLLVVDGSIPLKDGGVYSTIAGHSNLDMLKETAAGAAAGAQLTSCTQPRGNAA